MEPFNFNKVFHSPKIMMCIGDFMRMQDAFKLTTASVNINWLCLPDWTDFCATLPLLPSRASQKLEPFRMILQTEVSTHAADAQDLLVGRFELVHVLSVLNVLRP